MSDAVHTPLPWKLSPWHVEEGPSAARSSCKENFIICTTASDDDAALIVTAVNERPALLARVAELEAALRPFAEFADVCDHFGHDDERRLCHVRINGKRHEGVSVGDCRRARAAVSTTERGGAAS